MNTDYMNSLPLGGFNYDNCIRNNAMQETAMSGGKLQHMKTGTTICGVVFNVSSIISLNLYTRFRMASALLLTLELPEVVL